MKKVHRHKSSEVYERVRDEEYTYGSDSMEEVDENLRATEQEDLYVWKPAKFISYETMNLTSTKLNPTIRPCGFMKNGKARQIKNTCLLGRMKKLNILKQT